MFTGEQCRTPRQPCCRQRRRVSAYIDDATIFSAMPRYMRYGYAATPPYDAFDVAAADTFMLYLIDVFASDVLRRRRGVTRLMPMLPPHSAMRCHPPPARPYLFARLTRLPMMPCRATDDAAALIRDEPA